MITEHNDSGKLLAATITGSLVAAALTALTFAIGNATIYGIDGFIVLLFVVALLVGVPIAFVVGVPVGFVIAWLVGLIGLVTRMRAVAAGSLTALSLALAAIAIGYFQDGDATDYLLLLGGAALIGGTSGLAAYRVHFQPSTEA